MSTADAEPTDATAMLAVRTAIAARMVRWSLPPMLVASLLAFTLLSVKRVEATRYLPNGIWFAVLVVSLVLAYRQRWIAAAGAMCIGLALVTGSSVMLHSVHSLGYVGNLVLMALVVPLFGSRWGWVLAAWAVFTGGLWLVLHAHGMTTGVRYNTDINEYVFMCVLVLLSLVFATTPTRLLVDALRSSEARAVALQKARDEEAKVRTELAHARRLEALGQLSGGVAHDFNNMLGAIMGATEMIALTSPQGQNAAIDESVDLLREASARAADLTRKLLAFGRQDRFESRHVDLNKLVADVLAIARPSLGAKIAVNAKLSDSTLRVWGDGSALEHALLNMVLNARDAMPQGGTLTITTRALTLEPQWCASIPFNVPAGPAVMVSIEDSGTGMPAEVRERIFEPFFTTKPAGQGTGLGLSAVHGTVVSHRGAVEVDSEVGRGTVFHLYFPSSDPALVESKPPRDVVAAPHAASLKLRGTLLLVDDNALHRRSLTPWIERLGLSVIAVSDAATALSTLQSRRDIAVVLSDIVMPGMDGVALAQQIASRFSNVPLVLMSGFASRARMDELPADVVTSVLRKPVQPAELESALQQALSHPLRASHHVA